MPNMLLPPGERNLTPDQVEALNKRREFGHTLLVIAGQFTVIATVLLLWVGADLTYDKTTKSTAYDPFGKQIPDGLAGLGLVGGEHIIESAIFADDDDDVLDRRLGGSVAAVGAERAAARRGLRCAGRSAWRPAAPCRTGWQRDLKSLLLRPRHRAGASRIPSCA